MSILSRSLSVRKGRETGNRDREKRSYVFPFFLFFSLKERQAFFNAGAGGGRHGEGSAGDAPERRKMCPVLLGAARRDRGQTTGALRDGE